MSPSPPQYEVFAIRYARQLDRRRGENFIAPPASPDMHDHPMPIDFFVWVIRNDERTVVVDTGFGAEEAQLRQRELLMTPAEGLALLGIDAAAVTDVVITHLHYDHAGTTEAFASARFHLQDLEMQYATGRHMLEAPLRHAYSLDDVQRMVAHTYRGRVVFHDGDDQLAPGIWLHHIGGHTMGLQCVSVSTQRGRVVLAADAAHFYENMTAPAPFPIVYSVGDMLAGFHKMRAIASDASAIIPGHDPLVMERYPAPSDDLDGTVVRLDVTPVASPSS